MTEQRSEDVQDFLDALREYIDGVPEDNEMLDLALESLYQVIESIFLNEYKQLGIGKSLEEFTDEVAIGNFYNSVSTTDPIKELNELLKEKIKSK